MFATSVCSGNDSCTNEKLCIWSAAQLLCFSAVFFPSRLLEYMPSGLICYLKPVQLPQKILKIYTSLKRYKLFSNHIELEKNNQILRKKEFLSQKNSDALSLFNYLLFFSCFSFLQVLIHWMKHSKDQQQLLILISLFSLLLKLY